MITDDAPVLTAPPHSIALPQLALALKVDYARGLAADEAASRLARIGPNELARRRAMPVWRFVLRAVAEPFILLLLGAGALAIVLGEVRDGVLVIAGLLPIVGADVVTEYRAERALDALHAATAPLARVRRDGESFDLPFSELVPGDLVLLRNGDVVPADLRVVETEGLLVDRAALTGESAPEPVRESPDPFDAALADRRSVVYAGTSVVGGSGLGVVVATGAATELGKIASSLASRVRHRSPLQRELDRLVRILLVAALVLIGFTVGIGFLREQPLGTNLLAGISAAIAAIPEEPPILLAVVLGLGAVRLLRRGVLVRRLNAQETLGAVDLILTDKTGTLTENRLVLTGILTLPDTPEGDDDPGELLAEAFAAEHDAWRIAAGARPNPFTRAIQEVLERRYAIPFLEPAQLANSEPPGEGRAFSRITLTSGAQLVLGAPELVLMLCVGSQSVETLERWRELVESTAAGGGRLLMLARADPGRPWRPRVLLSFEDRLRDQIADAMGLAQDAGIQPLLVTGDHPQTAAAVAEAAGLHDGGVVTGAQIDGWSDDRLAAALPNLRVVARAVPDQKRRLVEVARMAGRTVAVTGDGVNDAPALHHADVGVAMGSGTQVAREAADLVLGDDSFATLMYGLREGRRMVDNVRKGLVFVVSTHVALLGFIALATAVGYAQPLFPLQILWLELFIDVATSVAFEREAEEPMAMRRPPRPGNRPLLSVGLLARIALAGGFSAVAALALIEWRGGDLDHARWLAYTALVVAQAVRAYANRSLSMPLHRLGMNRFLAVACLLVLVVQVAIPFIPPLADAFRASPLAPWEWGLVAGIALAPALVAELARSRGWTWVA